ncbi:MAG: hypothetical protein ACRDRL_15760 [Sciscionella sp.]
MPQFRALSMTNQPLELAVHLAFGALLALFVMHWRTDGGRNGAHTATGGEPVASRTRRRRSLPGR